MICSSEKRFFTSNLLGVGNWTPNQGATQTWGDVAGSNIALNSSGVNARPVSRSVEVSISRLIALSGFLLSRSWLTSPLRNTPRRDWCLL
ncbi:hypothetical protein EYC55_05885 [Xanthomonas oryzae]|nr:hypothetical protein EYC55_05885 [Xanthomonas oryzae]